MKSSLALSLLSLVLSGLAARLSPEEIAHNKDQGLRLLSIEEGKDPIWVTSQDLADLQRKDVHFFDVTETYDFFMDQQSRSKAVRPLAAAAWPAPSHQTAVKAIIATLKTANLQSNLATFTAYNNRYYTSSTGVSASNWIKDTLTTIASGRSDITVTQFTNSFAQKSVIATIAGSTGGAATILGGHLDSINQSNTAGRAPGADDDGSAVVALIETFRALVAAGFKPSTPVEFHFYAGEEAGLLGSQAIVKSYKSAGHQVKAVYIMDMIAYFQPGTKEVVAVVQDYTDPALNTFLGQLITAYSSLPAGTDRCDYACSDHATWYNAGYPVVYPFEAPTANSNPNIHTTNDVSTLSGFSFTHALEFVKLAVAFAYELAI